MDERRREAASGGEWRWASERQLVGPHPRRESLSGDLRPVVDVNVVVALLHVKARKGERDAPARVRAVRLEQPAPVPADGPVGIFVLGSCGARADAEAGRRALVEAVAVVRRGIAAIGQEAEGTSNLVAARAVRRIEGAARGDAARIARAVVAF
jgi:hypothetical protein